MQKRNIFIGGGILAIVFIIVLMALSGEEDVSETVFVVRGILVEEVSVTGTVEPKQEIDLAFEQVGTIVSLPFKVGAIVREGDVLAQQRNNELLASLREAEAQIKIEEARLVVMEKGTRNQEVNIKNTELEEERTDLENLYQNSATLIQDAQNDIDKALNDDVDALFTNGNTSTPQLTFLVADQSAELASEMMRYKAGTALADIITSKNKLSSKTISVDIALAETLSNVRIVESFLSATSNALNASVGVSATTLATYKTDINTARSSTNEMISLLETHLQDIATKKLSIDRLEQGSLLVEGGREEDIIVQVATIEKARANKDKISAQLAKTVLRSPIGGIVTTVDGNVGELVTTAVPVVSVMSQGGFEIVTNIPEADIVSISIGDSARVTLDAFDEDEMFQGTVVKINPAETTIEGVATYEVTLVFEDTKGFVRSGMTANVDIETDRKNDTLYVPSRSVLRKDGREYVRVVNDGIPQERDVVTGIKDVLGNIEIITGLKEGEEVITFVSEE